MLTVAIPATYYLLLTTYHLLLTYSEQAAMAANASQLSPLRYLVITPSYSEQAAMAAKASSLLRRTHGEEVHGHTVT